MFAPLFSAGLSLKSETIPPAPAGDEVFLTEEAAITPAEGEELRVDLIVESGALVAQGQPLLRLRHEPQIAFTAPMAGRIASLQLRPGHRLVQLVLFREAEGGRHSFDTADAGEDPAKLRALMQEAGLWRALRSRPFGHMPGADEAPAALFVMAADTRPGAPDPQAALAGREEAFERGLAALAGLTDGPVFLVAPPGFALGKTARRIVAGRLHPTGLAGMQIHRHFPAGVEARVWDIHAEDVAGLGELLATGLLPETRLVTVTGAALKQNRQLRCQPGADLRGLSHGFVRPGPHEVLSGSALDGQPAHWLGPRDRQVSVLPDGARRHRPHWFGAALKDASRPLPIIPTAALNQALGGGLPGAALVRALASGDTESATRIGALSLLEEDLALTDYVTAAQPLISEQLRSYLDRVEAEEVAE